MSDLFLAILKKVSLSYALTTLISFHEQNGLNCAWKDCEIASQNYQIHRCDRNNSKRGGGVAAMLFSAVGFTCWIHLVIYRVFQKFVPIVNCILRKAFNASLGKCKLIQVVNLSK